MSKKSSKKEDSKVYYAIHRLLDNCRTPSEDLYHLYKTKAQAQKDGKQLGPCQIIKVTLTREDFIEAPEPRKPKNFSWE